MFELQVAAILMFRGSPGARRLEKRKKQEKTQVFLCRKCQDAPVNQNERLIDMAFVYEESFRLSPTIAQTQPYLAADISLLLKNLKSVLQKISGKPLVTSEGDL